VLAHEGTDITAHCGLREALAAASASKMGLNRLGRLSTEPMSGPRSDPGRVSWECEGEV
jgi:hypothetical protein